MSSDHPQLPPGVGLELGEAVSQCPKAAQEGREQQSGMHIRPGSGHGDLGDVSTQPVEVGTKTGCPVGPQLVLEQEPNSPCEPQAVSWIQAPISPFQCQSSGLSPLSGLTKGRGGFLLSPRPSAESSR